MTLGPLAGTTAPSGLAPASAPTAPGGPSARSQGAVAGFERILLGQLTKTLVDSAMGQDGGPYAGLLPEVLADAVAGRTPR
jgi:hypothetical protein